MFEKKGVSGLVKGKLHKAQVRFVPLYENKKN